MNDMLEQFEFRRREHMTPEQIWAEVDECKMYLAQHFCNQPTNPPYIGIEFPLHYMVGMAVTYAFPEKNNKTMEWMNEQGNVTAEIFPDE